MCAKRYYMIESKNGACAETETKLDRLKNELALNDKWENEIVTILLNKEMTGGKKIEKIQNSIQDFRGQTLGGDSRDIGVHPMTTIEDDSIAEILLDSIPTKKQRERARILLNHLLKRITLTPEGRIRYPDEMVGGYLVDHVKLFTGNDKKDNNMIPEDGLKLARLIQDFPSAIFTYQ